MSNLFIASRRIDHDGSRRVVAAGSFIGDAANVTVAGEGADVFAGTIIARRLRRELAEKAAREEP